MKAPVPRGSKYGTGPVIDWSLKNPLSTSTPFPWYFDFSPHRRDLIIRSLTPPILFLALILANSKGYGPSKYLTVTPGQSIDVEVRLMCVFWLNRVAKLIVPSSRLASARDRRQPQRRSLHLRPCSYSFLWRRPQEL